MLESFSDHSAGIASGKGKQREVTSPKSRGRAI